MSVYVAPDGRAVEVAPGRGDLRFSSHPFAVRQSAGFTNMLGGRSISYANLFATQPWIAASVMRMLTWAVRVPLKCYRRDGDSRIQLRPGDHPAARLIYRPWMGQRGGGPANQSRLVQSLLGPVLVHGNSVVEIETVGGDDWLRPLDWRQIRPVGTLSGSGLEGWRYQDEHETRDIPVSSTVHLAWWSPLGPLGVSPLEQLGVTLSIEDAAQRYQQSLFRNGARPPSAITASADFLQMDRPERQALIDQLREDVEAIYSGPDNAGKPALLPPGLEWKAVGHTAVEAELIHQRQVAREEIAAVYQIPPPMLGILDNATYSNINTQREMAYTDALGPPLVLIEQALTAVIARDRFGEDDIFYEFDFGPVLRGDRLKEIDAFRLGIAGGIYTPNEVRRALNLPPDESPMADRLLYPANNLSPMPRDGEPQSGEGSSDGQASGDARRLFIPDEEMAE